MDLLAGLAQLACAKQLSRHRTDGQDDTHEANKYRDVGCHADRQCGQVVRRETGYQNRVHRAKTQHGQLTDQHRPGHGQDAQEAVAQRSQVAGVHGRICGGVWRVNH